MEKEYLYMDDFENVYEHDFDPEPEEISDAIISEIIKKYHLDEEQ